MANAVSINGKIVSPKDACVSVFDHGFLFGDSIYEVIRTVDGKLFMWDEHIKRLHSSADYIGLEIPVSDKTLLNWCMKTIEEGRNKESYIRLIITRGKGEVHIDPDKAKKPNVIFIVKKFEPYPEEYYRNGIKVTLASVRRNHPLALNPAAKTGNYLNSVLALREAKSFGAVDALMLSHSAYLTEATTSNLFFVSRGVLCTPSLSCGLLSGITRKIITEAAQRIGIQIKEGKFRKKSLFDADEAFLSSTLKDIMPIVEVYDVDDERSVKIGRGRPGPITRKLMDIWPEIVRAHL